VFCAFLSRSVLGDGDVPRFVTCARCGGVGLVEAFRRILGGAGNSERMGTGEVCEYIGGVLCDRVGVCEVACAIR
jgi:hypothetical protein